MTYTLLSDDSPSRRKILLSFYGLSVIMAVPYGALRSLVPGYWIYGDHTGASEASIHQAERIVKTQATLMFLIWVIVQFFVPGLIRGLRGPRNSFSLTMFGWALAAATLLGAYLKSLGGPSDSVVGFAVACSIFIGTSGALNRTAADIYLDYCAEWLARADLRDSDSKEGEAMSIVPKDMSQSPHSIVQHKALASSFKNKFASHLYSIIEVGLLVFHLPMAILGESAARSLLIAVAVCLSAGAFASLTLYNIQEPPEGGGDGETDSEAGTDVGRAEPSPSKRCACLRDSLMLAWESFVSCFKCLTAYRWMAALAFVPYFFGNAFADVYRFNILTGPKCGLDGEAGIGLRNISIILVISTMTQGVSAFLSPMLIGEGRFQFREHFFVLALGNLCGCLSMAVVMASGHDAICGSLGLMAGAHVLGAISFAVSNSVGVAATLTWYEGKYQHWVVAALASRSVWQFVGQASAPWVYTQEFGSFDNGLPCAALTLGIYAVGLVCVLAAHAINARRARLGTDDAMTAGFSADIIFASSTV